MALVGLGFVSLAMIWFGVTRNGIERFLSLVVWGTFAAWTFLNGGVLL